MFLWVEVANVQINKGKIEKKKKVTGGKWETNTKADSDGSVSSGGGEEMETTQTIHG